jgi:hypothetical protein
MVVIDDLDAVFLNDLVEIFRRKHITSLFGRILSFLSLNGLYWVRQEVFVKIETDFSLILSLVCLEIGHFHGFVED